MIRLVLTDRSGEPLCEIEEADFVVEVDLCVESDAALELWSHLDTYINDKYPAEVEVEG